MRATIVGQKQIQRIAQSSCLHWVSTRSDHKEVNELSWRHWPRGNCKHVASVPQAFVVGMHKQAVDFVASSDSKCAGIGCGHDVAGSKQLTDKACVCAVIAAAIVEMSAQQLSSHTPVHRGAFMCLFENQENAEVNS